MSEIPTYIPQLEQKEVVTKPIESEAYIDQTELFDFPFELDQLPRMLAHSEKTSDLANVATRTITEGRSLSYAPVVFKRKDGVNFMDLSLKGGGSEIKPNVHLFENRSGGREWVYDPDMPIPSFITNDEGEKLIVRYNSKPILTLTSLLGVHSTEAGMSDKYMSEYLEKKGLRTRTLVAAWKLPKETIMSTPEGEITAEQFTIESGVEPGLELWASRCKYRVQDILRYMFEIENPNPEGGLRGFKLPVAGTDDRAMDFSNKKSHESIVESLTDVQKDSINTNFTYLANEVSKRAQYDNDERFVQLAQKYQNIDNTNLESFYTDYLSVFSQVLGEQFAVMEKADAISGMFNLQNITLLAELVDHDVTMVDGKVMNNQGEFEEVSKEREKRFRMNIEDKDLNRFNQLSVGYDSIKLMLRTLSRAGILNLEEQDMRKILQTYINSFRNAIGYSYENHYELAEELLDIEKRKLKNNSVDYFRLGNDLAFYEDVINTVSDDINN